MLNSVGMATSKQMVLIKITLFSQLITGSSSSHFFLFLELDVLFLMSVLFLRF